MPVRPPRTCATPGCLSLAFGGGLCDKHFEESKARREAQRQVYQAESDKKRGSAASRGYDHRWKAYRASFLTKNPLCVACSSKGLVEAAKIVDHITPHNQDSKLFWDKQNHQGLCVPCHTNKTLAEMRAKRKDPTQRGT